MIDTDQLPKDPRHQRFADLWLAGMEKGKAYRLVWPRAKSVSPARVLRRKDVQAYIAAIQKLAATESILTVKEKRAFLARAVRTGAKDIDPDGENSDLVTGWSFSEGESSNSRSIRFVDPLAAIKLDNELEGIDAPSNALRDLADAFANLAPV